MNGLKLLLLFSLKLLLLVGVVGAIVYLAACTFLLLRQNRLIFFPSATISVTPQEFNLPYKDVWIPAETPEAGTSIEQMHGWWIAASGPERGVMLHLHGNGYNISANLAQALRFHQLGFSVLMVDYRGYGRSQGRFPTETSVYQDAKTAWNYLTQQRGIDPDRIFLFGHSLGGAIAIDLALNYPETAGLIVQSSFTSMREMVDSRGSFWMFPVDRLLNHRFDSIAKVRSLQIPVLYIHGTADEVVPPVMSKTLAAATPEPKQLVLIAGARHNDVSEIGGDQYLQAIEQFVERIYRLQGEQVGKL